ncbi:hypothetical protein HNR02_004004 [Amycolatopsis endophytica]|uniref:Uncharacterized protein n=1 Tax=Amycolatopsis endophytica TaxID=860233 RepID=A0A853B7J6_9PSEU|nr:hypothetical protein [Amycolatopsis endophytica]
MTALVNEPSDVVPEALAGFARWFVGSTRETFSAGHS